MTEENSVDWFEFKSDSELNKYRVYISMIKPLLDKHSATFYAKNNSYVLRLYEAEEAFCIVFSKACKLSSTSDLINYYNSLKSLNNPDLVALEIITDTLYDIAKYKFENSKTPEDKVFFSLFAGYDEYCSSMISFADGIINAVMNLYEFPNLSYEDRRSILAKNIIPVISANSKMICSLWEDLHNTHLIFLISSIHLGLAISVKVAESRLRTFLGENEYTKIQKMTPENIQTYIAAKATENPNMRQAKNLLKTKADAEYYLSDILKLLNELNITEEEILEAEKNLKVEIDEKIEEMLDGK